MPLSAFLDHVGLYIADHHLLDVHGTVAFDASTRCVTVELQALVILRRRLSPPLSGTELVPHSKTEPDSEEHPDDERVIRPRDRAGPTRDRTPRRARVRAVVSRDAPASPRRLQSAAQFHECLVYDSMPFVTVGTGYKRNQGYIHDVQQVHHPGDASVKGPIDTLSTTTTLGIDFHPVKGTILLGPADALCSVATFTHCAASEVMQETEVPLPGGFPADLEAVNHLPPPGGGPVIGDSASEGSGSTAVSEERCIEVRVFSFQRPHSTHMLWRHSEEDIDAFLTRAEILLSPTPEEWRLLPASPQPAEACFSLLRVPRWWSEPQILPVLCCVTAPTWQPFMQVAVGDDTLDDLIPPTVPDLVGPVDVLLPPGGELDASVGEASLDTVRPLQVLQPGAPVCLQPVDAPVLEVVDVSEHFRHLPHRHPPRLSEPSHFDPATLDVVFLGVSFEQFYVRLRPGSVREVAAEALMVSPDELYVHGQLERFDRLVVAGKHISCCFGFRFTPQGRRPHGQGLFIDPRAVGRPAMYSVVLDNRSTAARISLLTGVPVPAGYRPVCVGGATCADDVTAFEIRHGMTVVLWYESEQPARHERAARLQQCRQ